MAVDSAVPTLRKKLAHQQEKEYGSRDFNIEWEVRHGEDRRRFQGGAAEKVIFPAKLERVLWITGTVRQTG